MQKSAHEGGLPVPSRINLIPAKFPSCQTIRPRMGSLNPLIARKKSLSKRLIFWDSSLQPERLTSCIVQPISNIDPNPHAFASKNTLRRLSDRRSWKFGAVGEPDFILACCIASYHGDQQWAGTPCSQPFQFKPNLDSLKLC